MNNKKSLFQQDLKLIYNMLQIGLLDALNNVKSIEQGIVNNLS